MLWLVFVLRVVFVRASFGVDLLPRWCVHWSIGVVEVRGRRHVCSFVFEIDALEDQCHVPFFILRLALCTVFCDGVWSYGTVSVGR